MVRQRGVARVWHVSGTSIAVFVALSLAPMTGGLARAQTLEVTPGGAIGLGNRGWSASEPNRATSANELEFSARAGAASDYIYRGTTLSDHGPAAGAAVEARFGALYAGTTVATVKLPTQPVAEFTFAAGIRPKIATIDFDFGVTYFAYPGERLPGETGINYWEAVVRGDRSIGEQVRVAAGYAYSPNVSNTGAWSQYVAAGVGYDVPGRLLPPNLGVSFTTAAGYSWFGNQAPTLGGFPLPAYLNWQAGVTFTHKAFNLDLRYYDTNLSKENCFVFTGDPNARPGGRVDPVTNPAGLALELVRRDVRRQGLVCVLDNWLVCGFRLEFASRVVHAHSRNLGKRPGNGVVVDDFQAESNILRHDGRRASCGKLQAIALLLPGLDCAGAGSSHDPVAIDDET